MSVTGIKGCFCLSEKAHNRHVDYPGGHCANGTVEPGWLKHDFTCSKGHPVMGNTKEFTARFGNMERSKNIDVGSAAADFYLLESMAYDVANPRPFTVADVDGYNFSQLNSAQLLKLIGVSGPKTVEKFVEKHGESVDSSAALTAQYEKWKHVLAPNVPTDKSLAAIKQEASDLLYAGLEVLAPTFREYMHYANCSELSYHNKFSTAFDSDVGLNGAALGWMVLVDHVGGGEAARIAAELFRDKKPSGAKAWGNSYGGPKWAVGADVLSYFEDGKMVKGNKPFGPKLFVDRLFSLQHNTGSILNKVVWNYHGNASNEGYGCNNLIPLLDAHHNSNWMLLRRCASDEVRAMLDDYWTITNREFVRSGLEPVPFPTTAPAYTKGSAVGPDSSLIEEAPAVSSKASVLLAGTQSKVDKFLVPDEVILVGKKVVNKSSW